MIKQFLSLLASLFITAFSFAQDSTDISKMLEREMKADDKLKTQLTTATFKTTRLVNGHTVETTAKGVLDVKISHRFDPVAGSSGGAYNFFGLDGATMRLGFDYGLTDRLMVGIGRSTLKKTFDFLGKYKILQQSTGKVDMPITLDYALTFAIQSQTPPDSAQAFNVKKDFSNRLSYTHQIIIGRKFNERLSLQIMPSVVVRNLPLDGGKNNIWALGFGGRQKLSKRTSFNAEYYYQLPNSKVPGSRNSFSVGFDIETGGHVFQVHLTNAQGMTESLFIPETTQSWGKGEISIGFNISRVFLVNKKHTKDW